jgi:tRNA 2-selenouridine synthase SelU
MSEPDLSTILREKLQRNLDDIVHCTDANKVRRLEHDFEVKLLNLHLANDLEGVQYYINEYMSRRQYGIKYTRGAE